MLQDEQVYYNTQTVSLCSIHVLYSARVLIHMFARLKHSASLNFAKKLLPRPLLSEAVPTRLFSTSSREFNTKENFSSGSSSLRSRTIALRTLLCQNEGQRTSRLLSIHSFTKSAGSCQALLLQHAHRSTHSLRQPQSHPIAQTLHSALSTFCS